jgi:hypothetical protein
MEIEARKPATAQANTELDIAEGLRMLALYGGNANRASAALLSEGRPISAATLRIWQTEKYPVQYEDIAYRLRQDIGQKVSDGAMENATAAHALEAEMIAQAQQNLHKIPAKDLPKAALNMAQVKRTNVEVARLLRNEPTAITEVRDYTESLDELKSLGIIEVEAEEVDET